MDTSVSFNFVDAVVAVILLVGLLGGLKRGLSGELSRLLMYVIAGYAAWKYAAPGANLVMEKSNATPERAYLIAFTGILAGSFVVMFLARTVLRNILDFAFKGKIERMGGAICGVAKSAVIASVLLLLAGMVPDPTVRRLVAEESFAGRVVHDRLHPLLDVLREKVPGMENLPAGSHEPASESGELGEYQDDPYSQPAIEDVSTDDSMTSP